MPTLYIVATPIGNLEDITMRALRILSEVDLILCEDTRVTIRLLNHYDIKTPTTSYHQHSDLKKIDSVLDKLASGKDIALVADAGTPGISDPGGKLVQAVIERFNGGADVETRDLASLHQRKVVLIEAIPGPSAVTAALSISGIPTDKFVFMGFPPHKKGRQTFLRKIAESEYPVVVYESKHRILKFLDELDNIESLMNKKAMEDEESAEFQISNFKFPNKFQSSKLKKGKNKNIQLTSVVVCREISKMHETVYRGELKNIIEQIKNNPNEQKGEFVVIIGK
jgi:16S rRNA (cytidine1402-2'-O)-methyltransferase